MSMDSDGSELGFERYENLDGMDLRLDMKLAFNRVCSLIDSLPDMEEPRKLLLRIIREANHAKECITRKARSKLVGEKKGNKLTKNESDHLSTSTRVLEGRVQTPHFSEPIPYDLRERDTHNSSFYAANSSQRLLHTSLVSEPNTFQPISNKGSQSVVCLGTIPELTEEVNVIDSDSISTDLSYQEATEERTTYLVKKWSVKKRNNDLYITGIKMDRKGNIIEKDFISDEILSRQTGNVVRTAEYNILLDEPISDTKKTIPNEVREIFEKGNYFPTFWRKAVELWNKVEHESSVKSQKPKKSLEKKKVLTKNDDMNSLVENKRKAPNEDKKKTPNEDKKKTPNKEKKKNTNENQKKIAKEDKKKTPNIGKNKTTNDDKKKKPKEDSTKTVRSDKNIPPKENKKGGSKKTKEPAQATAKTTVNSVDVNDNVKKSLKKKKAGQPPPAHVEEKSQSSEEEDGNGESLPPGLEGDSMFLLPQTSLTPSGLLNSMRKTSVKGRFTPPTDLFDNIYGHTHSHNYSTNSSPGSYVNKNSNLVKRMAKAKTNTKGKKLRELGFVPSQDSDPEIIGEVLKAAGRNPVTTPPLLKEVFRPNEDSDDSSYLDSD